MEIEEALGAKVSHTLGRDVSRRVANTKGQWQDQRTEVSSERPKTLLPSPALIMEKTPVSSVGPQLPKPRQRLFRDLSP